METVSGGGSRRSIVLRLWLAFLIAATVAVASEARTRATADDAAVTRHGDEAVLAQTSNRAESASQFLSNRLGAKCPAPGAAVEKFFDNGNLYGVLNAPRATTTFTLTVPTCITSIMTYHYNGGRGAPAGYVWLTDNARKRSYGRWRVSAYPMGDRSKGDGTIGLYWYASPNIVLPPGTYTVNDSDPATWSHNRQNGWQGIAHVFGARDGANVGAHPPDPSPPQASPAKTATATPASQPLVQPQSVKTAQQSNTVAGEQIAAAGEKPKPASVEKSTDTTAAQSSPASSPPNASPVPVADGPPRILAPFKGYKTEDACSQAALALPGVPWRNDDGGASGAIETAQLGRYQALLRHTMRGLRLLYGQMTPVEDRNFDAFWAPFFDHPTAPALDYFEKITPLLNEFTAGLGALDGMAPGLGEAVQNAAITDADSNSGAVALAGSLYQQVKAERSKLDQVVKRIEALGNPPNPLAAKCRAQKRHSKALGEKTFFDRIMEEKWLIVSAYRGGQHGYVPSRLGVADRRSKTAVGNKIVLIEEVSGFGQPVCGLMNPQTGLDRGFASWRHRIEMDFTPDHRTIVSLSAKVERQICRPTQLLDKAQKLWRWSDEGVKVQSEVELRDVPAGTISLEQKVYGTKGSDKQFTSYAYEVVLSGGQATGRVIVARSTKNWDEADASKGHHVFENRAPPVGDRIVISAGHGLNSYGLRSLFAAIGWTMDAGLRLADGRTIKSLSVNTNAQNKASETQPQTSAAKPAQSGAPDPGGDAILKAEAMAHHSALANQIRKDAARWADDATRETDGDRKAELLKRSQEMNANAQAEQDIAESLRTGVIVHTRTAWDEAQHQALVSGIKSELATFEVENRLLANIPSVADLTNPDAADRDRLHEQISQAIKSPDAVKQLSTIYTGLKEKVIEHGARQMASAQEKVEVWDQRVRIAESVETTAGLGFMLATLWSPVAVAKLGIGYAGATGFVSGYAGSGYVSDGVLGGVVAVSRSYSATADVVISAYEGATRVDPTTGEPGGIWGAVEGALWSIGTNKVMEAAGGRIQRARAEYAFRLEAQRPTSLNPRYAVEMQAKGVPGVKPVAKATREARIKEFDFKTPEERFHAELAGAKTPAEKAAVQKKHAILNEREAMHAEKEAALHRAEQAVSTGTDPAEAKQKYESDLAEITKKYEGRETRNGEHEKVMEDLGFNGDDLKHTGSKPNSAASDIDLTPGPESASPHDRYQKARRYIEAMKKRDHNVVEYGDRWVDTTIDATIWKPGFGADKPGSGSFEAEVMFGTLPHSDKFGTKGGIEFTSKKSFDDPYGAVLANAGKAVSAGLGGSHPVDLHTVGKSAVKAAEAAGITVEPGLKSQIEGLKAHQTPEQAGVLTLGADQATKTKEKADFMKKIEVLFSESLTSGKARSDSNLSALEKQAAAKGSSDDAYDLLARIKTYQAGNDAALTTIARGAPGLAAKMAQVPPATHIAPELTTGKNLNLGGLLRSLFKDRDAAQKAKPLSADSNDPALAGLKDRCKEAALRAEARRGGVKPGTDEARYLGELKAALEKGAVNPADAIRSVRLLSGHELSVVLAQLGVPAGTKN
ncbi:MAG: hypothetical protein KDJ25_01080 [Rhodoblastus sp.]|nr:hypothetical protein [Rhodoblastus sp.]